MKSKRILACLAALLAALAACAEPATQNTQTKPGDAKPLWIDENSPANPSAAFHIGMSLDDAEQAIERLGLEVINVWDGPDYKGYDTTPFSMSIGLEDGLRYVQLGFFDDHSYMSANGFNGNSTIADVEDALGRPLAAAALDDSIIYLYEANGCYAEIYMHIEKPFSVYLINLTADVKGHIASPEFDEYDEIKEYASGNTETIESPAKPLSTGPELLYFADADGVERGHANGVVQKGRFYHDGQEIWLSFYYMAVGPKQYAELAGLTYVQLYDEPKEVQLMSNTVDLEEYIGKHIVFATKQSFEGHTIYHRRDYVVDVAEIIKVIED